MGSAEVGESGRAVNPLPQAEWVRIPPPQLGLKGCYIPPTTAIKIHENGEDCNNENITGNAFCLKATVKI